MSMGDSGRDRAIEKLLGLMSAAGPLSCQTDKYFSYARRIVAHAGDKEVTYALFMRRRVVAALEPAIRLVREMVPGVKIKRFFDDGVVVPSERKLLEIRGLYSHLSEVETLLLQKVGFPCVCAHNAYELCRTMPGTAFLDMHARHATGPEMGLMAAYGASVGSEAARCSPDVGAVGFIGSSQDLTAPLFGGVEGIGTIPHGLVGYMEGDVVAALRKFHSVLPEIRNLTALVDYRGQEKTDSLLAAEWFFNDAGLDTEGKTLSIRIDTHGGRFAEGLDYEKSVELVGDWLGVEGEYNIVESVMGRAFACMDSSGALTDQVRRILFGKGVSIASTIYMRRILDGGGFNQVRIIASSGFDMRKCLIAGAAGAPIDIVGTGSYLPESFRETYATADIISYDGKQMVKLGREHLFD